MKLSALVGSGHRIGLLVLPFLVVGAALNLARPSLFSVGGPPAPRSRTHLAGRRPSRGASGRWPIGLDLGARME